MLLAVLVVTATGAAVTATAGSASAARASPHAVDVVFVVDRSANAESLGTALGDELSGFAAAMDDRGIDARYGLVTYESDATVRTALTADAGAVRDDLASVSYEGSFENASDGVVAGDGLSFRSDAKRVYVVLTNEDDSSAERVRTEADGTLSADGTTLFAAGPDGWERRAGAVGGTWYDIPSAFENGSADVAGAVDALETTVADVTARTRQRDRNRDRTEDRPRAHMEVTDVSIDRAKVVRGSTATITVTVTNDGAAPGTFQPVLTADGRTLQGLGERDRITVDESRRYRFEQRFTNLGHTVLMVGGEHIGDITVVTARSMVSGPPTATVDVTGAGAAVRLGNLTDGEVLTVDLPANATGRTTGVGVERLHIRSDGYGDATVSVSQQRPPQSDAPDDAGMLSTLEFTANGSAVVERVGVEFTVNRTAHPDLSGRSVYVSRLDESGERARLNATLVETTPDSFGYEVDTGTEFAGTYRIAAGEPSVTVDGVTRMSDRTETPARVAATLHNNGTGGTLQAVPLRLDGRLVALRMVELPADSTRTVVFTVPPARASEYRVTVGAASGGTMWFGPEAAGTTAHDGR